MTSRVLGAGGARDFIDEIDFLDHRQSVSPLDAKTIKTINQQNLDIAFFPDIGMSSEFYFLSYIRFAKIQMTSWGHPVTTGNSSIDYFLSSKLLETKDSQKYFSEKLVSTNYLPMFF